jgi:hypothetical protein
MRIADWIESQSVQRMELRVKGKARGAIKAPNFSSVFCFLILVANLGSLVEVGLSS